MCACMVFLARLKAVRIEEFESATEPLSKSTRSKLVTAITEALADLDEQPCAAPIRAKAGNSQ